MKQCATCGEFKNESEYNWRNKLLGKRWGTCRDCQKRQKNDWYAKNKDTHKENVYARKLDKKEEARSFIYDYLSTHYCIDCGEADPVVLEFDHVRGNKRLTISKMVGDGYSVRLIKKEIGKCEVRCRNCHVRKTHREQGSFRDQW